MSEVKKDEQLNFATAGKEETKEVEAKDTKKGESKEKAKPKAKKEERYKGQLIFVSGPQQTPLDLDKAFATNEDFNKNDGATKDMIKKIAENVFLELKRPEVDIVIVEHEKQQYCYLQNTLSKKGTNFFKEDGPQIIAQSEFIPFEEVEEYFKYIYDQEKTEARALIYYSTVMQNYLLVIPEEQSKSGIHISNSFDYCLNNNPKIYLVADFHSHHNMSNKFSIIDDADEAGKENILFGVYSFKDGWNFRIIKNGVVDGLCIPQKLKVDFDVLGNFDGNLLSIHRAFESI